MKKQGEQINALNAVLRGEHMALDIYNIYIDKIDDKKLAEKMQKISNDHKNNAYKISSQISNLGANPEENRGMAGAMSRAMGNIKTMAVVDEVDILKHLYNGEDKGIAAALEVVQGDLNTESKKLIGEILSNDHDHLKEIKTLISEYEQR